MQLRVAADVYFLDDRAVPAGARRALVTPSESGIDDAASRHEGCTVTIIKGQVIARLHFVAEQGWVQVKQADDRFGIRIE
jgi:hypothetical protein